MTFSFSVAYFGFMFEWKGNFLNVQIICADGQSCSGQTPDMAWEKFQKTFFPRLKVWHGKRFSCKIDGVEVEIDSFFVCSLRRNCFYCKQLGFVVIFFCGHS